MAFKTFCDICKKDISDIQETHVRDGRHMYAYCPACWANSQNWQKIHVNEASSL